MGGDSGTGNLWLEGPNEHLVTSEDTALVSPTLFKSAPSLQEIPFVPTPLSKYPREVLKLECPSSGSRATLAYLPCPDC